jgi:hypothetical protein
LLAPGSDGAPWLFVFDHDVDPPCLAVFRFDPWQVTRVGDIVIAGTFESSNLEPTRPPDPRTPLASLGPDAFAWLTAGDTPFLVGMRAGVRGALSQYETSLLVPLNEDPQRPVHLSPDRPPPQTPGLPMALFTAQRLILEKREPGVSAVSVYVTDTRYDDVAVTVEFSTAGPPVVLFGAYEVGGRDCAWPTDPASPLVAVRRGTEVTATDDAGATARCTGVPSGMLTIGARAGETSSTITAPSIGIATVCSRRSSRSSGGRPTLSFPKTSTSPGSKGTSR